MPKLEDNLRLNHDEMARSTMVEPSKREDGTDAGG